MERRVRLDRVSEMLTRLEEGRFMYGLECVREGAGVICNSFRRLQQNPLSPSGEVPEVLAEEQQFVEALRRICRSLQLLRPTRLCQLLDDLLDALEYLAESDDSLPTAHALAQIQRALDQLAAAQLLSRLEDLALVLQEVRPPAGFQPESYHPRLAARLHKLYVLPVLDILEEELDLMFSPTNILLLHGLQDFVRFRLAAPAA